MPLSWHRPDGMDGAGARTVVVLPVKSLHVAKHRLSPLLSPSERRALMAAMLGDVLDTVNRVQAAFALVVVTRDADAAAAARAHGARVIADGDDVSHSAAAGMGIAAALADGAQRVVLIPGDCPLLAPADLEILLRLAPASHGRVVIVADRDGEGTNALALEPPGVITPAFGPGSYARHVTAGQRAGVPVHIERLPSLQLDVDTPADLRALADVLAERPGDAPRTARLLADLPVARPATR
jgi:2-phospho-L-lactate guanylyltransferase